MANLAITPGSVSGSSAAQRQRGFKVGASQASITPGQLVYLDASSNWELINALTSSTTAGVGASMVGIATNEAYTGQYLDVVTSDPALVVGGTLTPGIFYGSSATSGAIAPLTDLVNTGDIPLVIGTAITGSTTVMNFQPFLGGSVHA